MTTRDTSIRLLTIGSASLLVSAASGQGVGYDDTPQIPGQEWRVHDINRPNPPVVDPGPAATITPAPGDAVVLFDGSGLDAWQHGEDKTAEWKILPDLHAMEVKAGSGDLITRESFGDVQLHLEFATPVKVEGESQQRGNSGVFFFGRYEIQILDSYENKTYADGQAGAVYGQFPPLVNASRKPGEWQTFDIIFEAPRFGDDGAVLRPAYVTVIHNGVVVQNHRALIGPTQHRTVATYAAHEPTGQIKLQDHGNPMRFRNIWVRPLELGEAAGEGEHAGQRED